MPIPDDNKMTPRPIIERHIQSFLLSVIIALAVWQGSTTFRLSEISARQDERVTHLISLTEQLRQDLRNIDAAYLPRREAEMYRNETDRKLEELSNRVGRLEIRQ